MLHCFQLEPYALNVFNLITKNEQIGYVMRIYTVQTEQKK